MFNHRADCGDICHEFYDPHIWVALVLVFQYNIRIIAGIFRDSKCIK
jgi:hypothetical protein